MTLIMTAYGEVIAVLRTINGLPYVLSSISEYRDNLIRWCNEGIHYPTFTVLGICNCSPTDPDFFEKLAKKYQMTLNIECEIWDENNPPNT